MCKVKNRYFGLDLLKILLPLMVISIHFGAEETGRVWSNCTVMPMRLFMIILDAVTLPAVNCYVLISSYCSFSNEKNFKSVVKGLSRIWITLVTYSVLGYLAVCVYYHEFSIIDLIKRFFPVIRGEWWFMTNYFALMLISPFLKGFLKGISLAEHRLLMIIAFAGCSVFPFFTLWEEDLGLNYGYSLLWFTVLFLIGSYLKRINIEKRKHSLNYLCCYLFCACLLQAIPFALNRISFTKGMNVSPYNSFLLCLESVFLFLAFLHVPSKRIAGGDIAKLASLSMASYIFHCQEDLSGLIWELIHPSTYANSYYLFPLYFAVVFGLYSISIIIEAVRRKIMSISSIEDRMEHVICMGLERAYHCADNMVVKLLKE